MNSLINEKREDEYSHKGIDRAALIDKSVIESSDYKRKFDNATENPQVNKTLYTSAKEMLYDRSGTHYESMRWIDGETGEIIAKFDNMGRIDALSGKDHELKVEYGANTLHKLKGHNNIIVIHNHPNSSAPSAGDFNSAFVRGYALGFVATHDGRLFKYSSAELISEILYTKYWQRNIARHYDEVDAQIIAIKELSRNLKITFKEVIHNDMV
ncbi:MAG: hypothetical protein LBM87_00495 [Ruminococcus sp.]|jgi:hypothetical protein|nr:hypothetical protein [Ruminococcus sp.]